MSDDPEIRSSDRGCFLILAFIFISPLIWLGAVLAGASGLEQTMRVPGIVGLIAAAAVIAFLWWSFRGSSSKGWSRGALPAGVRPLHTPPGQLWSGNAQPDRRLGRRTISWSVRTDVGRHPVYGLLAEEENGPADWFMMCRLPYALPDLDLRGAGADTTINAGPDPSAAIYAADIDAPALREALQGGTGAEVRIRGIFVLSEVNKRKPKPCLAALSKEAPRLAAVVDAIGRDVFLRWSPQARNELERRTEADGDAPQWETWDPRATGQVQDPESDPGT